jgi:peptidyl-prolyl cis-trans isomerase C
MNTPTNRLTTRAAASTWTPTLGLLAALVVATPAWSQAAASQTTGTITVNGEAQPARYAELLLNDQLARGATDSPTLRAQVRETVINQALMAQAASKAKLESQPDVRAQLALARQSALAQAWQQQALRGVRITDADLAAEYQRQVQALGSEEVRLRHVLVPDEQQAGQVLAQLAGGAAFEALAAEVSRDNSTRERGGLSDWVAVGSLAPGVAQAVQALSLGQLAATPIETPSGWQVLKLEARRSLSPPPLEAVGAQLRRTLEQRALQARLQTLRGSARVE